MLSLAVPRPSASLPEPFLASFSPSSSLLAPSAASAVRSCRSENDTKILSRKAREDFAEVLARISEKTVLEIEPTM